MAETPLIDPRKAGPVPPFKQGEQEYPGKDQLQPPADHGEESYRGTGKLSGWGTLVTGADSGIGRAVAIAYAREGADVLISYLEENEDAKETERLVQEAGQKAVRVPGDVGDPDHCNALVDRAMTEFGRLDVLVNNAAFQVTRESIEELTFEEFDRVAKSNIYATFFLSQAALPRMKPGNSIINTTSIQGSDPSPQLLPYAASKGWIDNFTQGLAQMAMERGIRVNAVAPGPVWTPLIPATMPKEKVQNFGGDSVIGRPAQPAELAPVFVWLASNEASYIFGEIYGVTGGRMQV